MTSDSKVTSLAFANALAATALSEGCRPSDGVSKRVVVICPGSRSTPLVAAMAGHPQMVCHVIVDERCAAFVALGIARVQGQAAVMICTSGSAGAHALPACIEAAAAQIPWLIVTANRPARLWQCGAPQTTRQDSFFSGHIKQGVCLPEPRLHEGDEGAMHAKAWRSQAQQALSQAEMAPCGPVHLDAPMDEPLLPSPTADAVSWAQQVVKRWPRQQVISGASRHADPGTRAAAVAKTLERLRSWRRGVLICGPMLGHDVAGELGTLMRRLAACTGWPLLCDPASQIRFGTERAMPYDLLLRSPRFFEEQGVDGFLRVGHNPTSKSLQRWLIAHATGQGVLIEPSGQRLDPDDTAGLRIVDDEVAFLAALVDAWPSDEAKQTASSAWSQRWQAASARVHRVLDDPTWWQRPLWDGAAVVAACAGLAPRSRVLVGSSLPIRDVDSLVHRLADGVAVVANRGVNGIDGTLSCGLGLALGAPNTPTVIIAGDLTCLHDMGALQAARQLDVCLLVVVVDNHGGKIFEQLPIAHHAELFERFFLTPQKADFSALATATGAGYLPCDDTAELTEKVADWCRLRPPGVTLVHARCAQRGPGPRQPLLAAARLAAEDEGSEAS